MTKFLPIALAAALAASAQVHRNGVFEAAFISTLADAKIEVEFIGPGGAKHAAQAFWDGGAAWKVRFSPDREGGYKYAVRSNDKALDGKTGEFRAAKYSGRNPLYRFGHTRLSADRRYIVQDGGRPWFFLSDTAWNGALLSTDEEWAKYIAQRAGLRYTAVQFVMTQWRAGRQDENGEVAFTGSDPVRINPKFFQRMDRKITALNQAGLVAIPVMLWALTSKDKESPGENLPPDQAGQLAAYMRARYGAHHVIWMLGGDGDYRGPNVEKWKTIARIAFPPQYKRQLAGMHPRGMQAPWEPYKGEPWMDIFFYQTGHGSDARKWRWNATEGAAKDWKLQPAHPVIDAEPNYEGHMSYQKKLVDDYDVRRASYYSLLSAPPAGITYGAHGIWFWSRKPEVPLDHPGTGVAQPWHECIEYPGSKQMKTLRDVLDRVDWWELRPDRSLMEKDTYNAETFADYTAAARTLDGKTAVLYLPRGAAPELRVSSLGKAVRAEWIDPRDGSVRRSGSWPQASPSNDSDWLLILRGR